MTQPDDRERRCTALPRHRSDFSDAHSTSSVRTSLSHPLRIDAVPAGDARGLIGITFCPGKSGSSLGGFSWKRELQADLDVIALWRPCAMVTLIEDHEFQLLGVPELGVRVRARGLDWHHLPIVDVQPPDARFEAGWRTSGPALAAALRSGERVLVHCRGGLGRAGTVAARLLIDMGVAAPEAIERVRRVRPGAIETIQQQGYLIGIGANVEPRS